MKDLIVLGVFVVVVAVLGVAGFVAGVLVGA